MKRILIIIISVIILTSSIFIVSAEVDPADYWVPEQVSKLWLTPRIVGYDSTLDMHLYLADGVSLVKKLPILYNIYSAVITPSYRADFTGTSSPEYYSAYSTVVYTIFINRYIEVAGLTYDLSDLNVYLETDYTKPNDYLFNTASSQTYSDMITSIPSGSYTSQIYFGNYRQGADYTNGMSETQSSRFLICDSSMDDLPDNVAENPDDYYRMDMAIYADYMPVPNGDFENDYYFATLVNNPYIHTTSVENRASWGAYGLFNIGQQVHMWNIIEEENWSAPVWQYKNTGYMNFDDNGGRIESNFRINLPNVISSDAIVADKTLTYLTDLPPDEAQENNEVISGIEDTNAKLDSAGDAFASVELPDTTETSTDLIDTVDGYIDNIAFIGERNPLTQIMELPLVTIMMWLACGFALWSLILFGKKG